MNPVFCSLLSTLFSCLRTRASLQVEILALRHQVIVLATGEETSELESRRSLALGVAVAVLGAMALSIGHSQAGDGDCLAAKGVSTLLDLEEQGREERSTKHQQGSVGVGQKR